MEKVIYERKSARKYLDEEVDLNQINDLINSSKTLNDSEFWWEILTKDEVDLRTRWSAPYYISIHAKKDDLYLENVGFVFEQVSLALNKIGLGSCWVGMGKPKNQKEDFIILMALGKSDDNKRDITEFKRKDLTEITDEYDERLKPAQYAPSAINSQPWYFTHTENGIDVYTVKQNILKRKILGKLNQIDTGIALAHLYVSNRNTFTVEFSKKELNGYRYICSVQI